MYSETPNDSRHPAEKSRDSFRSGILTEGLPAEKSRETLLSRSGILTAEIEIIKFEQQAVDGHRGEVLCVDATPGLDYIVSGGEDCTTRLWKYFEDELQCYRLYHLQDHCACRECDRGVLSAVAALSKEVVCKTCSSKYTLHPEQHKDRPAVTSVAFASTSGPAISVTRNGALHVMNIETRGFARFQLFSRSINTVRAKRTPYVTDAVGVHPDQVWLVSLSSGTHAGLYEIHADADGTHYNYKLKASFTHMTDVLFAEHVPGDVNQGAALATCTLTRITLWTLKSEIFNQIEPVGRHFSSLRVSMSSPNGGWGWLVASGSEMKEDDKTYDYVLSFWPMKDGVVCPDGVRKEEWPLEYKKYIKEHIHEISISPDNRYVMLQYAKESDFIQIAPSPDGEEGALCTEDSGIVAIEGCPHKILKEDPQNFLLSLSHKSHCNEMCMRYDIDKDSGTNLAGVLAFENGSVGLWDLQGSDRGQKIADLRSMSIIEIMTPVIIRCVTFGQVMTFAFGPSTNFSDRVQKPIKFSSKLVQFQVIDEFFPDASLADLFLPEVNVIFFLAATYVLLAVTGAPEILASIRLQIGHSRYFDKGWCSCCLRTLASFVTGVRSCACFLLGTCSTILVVPMFKLFAKVVDCEMLGQVKVLAANPDIICYNGFHWKLVAACAILLPIYFVTLLPYAVVNGDSNFVVRSSMLSPTEWRLHAVRQATLIYQGAMHPKSEHVFLTRTFELCVKIVMPCIVILTTSQPLFQTVAIFVCGLGSYLISLLFKPLVDRVMNAAVQGGQLFTVTCMLCGVLTVAFPTTKEYSIIMLVSCLVFSIAITCLTLPPKPESTSEFFYAPVNQQGSNVSSRLSSRDVGMYEGA